MRDALLHFGLYFNITLNLILTYRLLYALRREMQRERYRALREYAPRLRRLLHLGVSGQGRRCQAMMQRDFGSAGTGSTLQWIWVSVVFG